MKIAEKIHMGKKELLENGPITIVAFGDSVTHGALSSGEIDYNTVYWNRLREKILAVRNYVPVNVINAGIGATNATNGVDRMDKQVFAHLPDLVIVCFGLNDVKGKLEDYLKALRSIFGKCHEQGCDVIFMTPNMLNTYIAEDTPQQHLSHAALTSEHQNSGKMDLFMKRACELAEEMEVSVCDCYSMWKELSKTQDTTKLLANRINHPIREMHELFAESLFRMIFKEEQYATCSNDSMMYELRD